MDVDNKISFSFGKNWGSFIENHYSEEALEEAIKSLQNLYQSKSLKGKSFMDIGCGSGLFSLAAYYLGAQEIISFDINSDSVSCCRLLWEKVGCPKSWKIVRGSILDTGFISTLRKADVVYSWGVLHHTGDMWTAINNSFSLVKDDGYFVVAIYNKSDAFFGSKYWLMVKRIYNRVPSFAKKLMEVLHTFCFVMKGPIRRLSYKKFLKNIEYIKNYRSHRGMNWSIDVKDWLGGLPYEYATDYEIKEYCEDNNFETIKINSTPGIACNEFLFKKIEK